MRPRVLFLHASDELYGSDQVLIDVLEALADLVVPVVVLPSDAPAGPLSAELRRKGITVERIPFMVLRRRYGSPTGLLRLGVAALAGSARVYLTARRHHVRAIHANTSAILLAPALAAVLRVPWIWHLHEIVERPRWLSGLIGWLSRRHRGRVVTVSHAVARHLANNGGAAARVIHNAAPASREPVAADPRLRSVLMAGRVNGWKGHVEFVMAARLLHEAGVDATYRLLGGPVPGREALYQRLEQWVSTLDPSGSWIVFAGQSSRVAEEMNRATLVVVPSIASTGIIEGFNRTALEAMTRGRPVVASATGGLPEVVMGGETGLLVPPGDVTALAGAMRSLIEDPVLARRMGEAGRERASREFSAGAFRSKWRALYREVLSTRVIS